MLSSCDKFLTSRTVLDGALNTKNCGIDSCTMEEPMLITQQSNDSITIKAQEQLLCHSRQHVIITTSNDTLSYEFKTAGTLQSYSICDKEVTIFAESKKVDLSLIKYIRAPHKIYSVELYTKGYKEVVQNQEKQ